MKLLAGLLLFGAILSAGPLTTAQVTLTSAGNPLDSDGKYYVGPYSISGAGFTNVPVLCIDVDDESYVGETWTANISQVGGDISGTYHPTNAVAYQEEAYLYSLIVLPNADRVDIQHAAWHITDSSYALDANSQVYYNWATDFYSTVNDSYYFVVSSSTTPHAQEFIGGLPCTTNPITPEPASWGLMGGGLLCAGIVVARRRQKEAAIQA